MTVLVVTGTDTGVGKTLTTAALTATLTARGDTVAVYKPVQAGTENGEGDTDVIRRLTGCVSVCEGIRLVHPMAPVAAATRSGARLPGLQTHRETIRQLSEHHDHVLIEGSGGLLVALNEDGHTLADLAVTISAATIVVCRSSLGTLNHTALTIEALTRRQITIAGLVIGAWPRHPTEVELGNLNHLSGLTTPLVGTIPEAAGHLPGNQFRRLAPNWFSTLPTFWRS
ncbi:dethiobiotin synthase [Pseudonocardia sp. GCM10023141]|uniref:dethiobiotin synthase n=1 Tax=Pseudonocardia sp. GCM10023141 TaxID=3252653 RepID=UPI00361EA53B